MALRVNASYPTKDKVVHNDKKTDDNAAAGTPQKCDTAGRLTVSKLACRSGAALTVPKPKLGAMCEQARDWSRGNSCIPQKFVRLIGYREPDARPSSPLPPRPLAAPKKRVPSDTPIG